MQGNALNLNYHKSHEILSLSYFVDLNASWITGEFVTTDPDIIQLAASLVSKLTAVILS